MAQVVNKNFSERTAQIKALSYAIRILKKKQIRTKNHEDLLILNTTITKLSELMFDIFKQREEWLV